MRNVNNVLQNLIIKIKYLFNYNIKIYYYFQDYL